jgi:hypothetical protein
MPHGTLLILGYPAVLMNIIYGQNGFLTTALFGGGIVLLRRYPIASGICFGCLIYKPHLALVVPVALLVRKEWKTFASAFATAMGLCGLSLVLFGSRTWAGFLAATPMARATLEQGLIEPHNWASTFAGARLLHGSIGIAFSLRLVVSLAALTAVVFARRSPQDALMQGILPLSCLLVTPYLVNYDLLLLVIPMMWLLREAQRIGWLPWEKTVLCLAFAVPVLALLAADWPGIPVAPIVLLALLCVALRRVRSALGLPQLDNQMRVNAPGRLPLFDSKN